MKRLLILSSLLSVVSYAQVNTQYGQQAGASEQYSADISLFGYQAMYACTYCFGTTAMGYQSLRVTSGPYNTAIGYAAMIGATSGSYNTAIGAYSMENSGSGNQNVAIGYDAGSCENVNGSNNIWIANCGLLKDNATIRIGTQGVQKFAQVAGIYNTKLPAGGGQYVMVNSKGQLGIVSTVLHTSVVTQADLATLRNDLVTTKNMVYQLQRDNAALKARLGLR